MSKGKGRVGRIALSLAVAFAMAVSPVLGSFGSSAFALDENDSAVVETSVTSVNQDADSDETEASSDSAKGTAATEASEQVSESQQTAEEKTDEQQAAETETATDSKDSDAADLTAKDAEAAAPKAKAPRKAAANVTEHTVKVQFFDYDNETAVNTTGTNVGDKYYLLVRLYAPNTGELIAYRIQKIENGFNNIQSNAGLTEKTITVNAYSGFTPTEGENFSYNFSDYMISTRVFQSDSNPEFGNIVNKNDEFVGNDNIDGYIFDSNIQNSDGTISTIRVYKADERQLNVKLIYDETPSALTDADHYYMLVMVKHQTGNPTYYFEPLITDGNNECVVSINKWKTGGNEDLPYEQFSGNETDVSVKIIRNPKSENIGQVLRDRNDGTINSDKVEEILTGGNVGDFKVVSYPTNVAPSSLDISEPKNHIINYTATVKLSKLATESALTPQNILGDAVEYGIVANRYDQFGHTETNFAVNYLFDTTNNDIDGSGTGAIPFYVAEITNEAEDGTVNNDSKLWLSSGTTVPADIYVGSGSVDKVNVTSTKGANIIEKPEATITKYVNGLISSGTNKSVEMANKSMIAPVFTGDGYELDTTGFPDSVTIYVNADGIMGSISKGGWYINKKPNQSIVFNISKEANDKEQPLKISQFYVCPNDDPDGEKYKDKEINGKYYVHSTTAALNGNPERNERVDEVLFEHISFNVINAKYVHLDNASGLFLLPSAEKVTQSNGAGWILAKGTVHSEAEWHFYRHARNYKALFSLSAQKILKNNRGKALPYEDMGFEFELYQTDDTFKLSDGVTPLYTTLADKNGNISFRQINYSNEEVPFDGSEHNFYYVVKEKTPEEVDSNIQYNADPIKVKVSAKGIEPTSPDEEGSIEVKVYIVSADGSPTEIVNDDNEFEIGDFVNTYDKKELVVKKKWLNSSNIDVSDKQTGKIFFKLVQVATEVKDTPQLGDDKYDVSISKAQNDNDSSKEEIEPLSLKAGTIIKITVVEGSPWLTPTVKTYDYETFTENNPTYVDQQSNKDSTFVFKVTVDKSMRIDISANNWAAQKPATITYSYTDQNYDPSSDEPTTLEKQYPDNRTIFELNSNDDPSWEKAFDIVEEVDGSNSHKLPLRGINDQDIEFSYTYKVVEVSEDGTEIVDGVSYSNNNGISDGEVTIINKTETEEAEVGSLKVEKKFSGIEADNLTAAQKSALSFTVKNSAGKEVASFTYADMTNGAKTIENLPVGEYTVTESGADKLDVNGKSFSETTYSVEGGKATVENGKTANVTVTNTYTTEEAEVGSLKVEKKFSGIEAGNLTADQKKALSFIVKNSAGKEVASFTYADMTNGAKTIENLSVGEYTVTESGADKLDVNGKSFSETTYSVEGGKTTVENGKTANVTVTNTYTQDKGSLKVTKTVTGEPAGAATKEYKFTVKAKDGSDYVQENGSLGSSAYKFTVKAGETATISNIPVGDYVVTEDTTDAAIDGYTLAATGGGDVSVTKNDEATSTLTNAYTEETAVGSLKVTKNVTGEPAGAATKEYKFTVKVKNGSDYVQENGSLGSSAYKFTVKAGETATISNIPVGGYVVTEDTTDAAIDGYTLAATGGGDVSVTKNGEATSTLTNAYTEETAVGSLKVTKNVTGEPAGAATKEYKFTVKVKNGSDYVQADGSLGTSAYEFTVKAGETATISNIPIGDYVVAEDTTDAAITGYTLAATGGGDVSVTKNGEATSTLTNAYTSKKVEIEIQKADTDDQNMELDDCEMAVIEWNDETGVEGTEPIAQWTSKAGELKSVEVELGKTYILRELKAPIGYALTKDTKFTVYEENGETKIKYLEGEGAVRADGVLLCQDMMLTGDAQIHLTGTKELKDGDISKYNFKFNVYNKDEYEAYKAGGDKPEAVSTATTKNAAPNEDGVVSLNFSDIEYTFDDLKVYDEDGNITKILPSKTFEYVIVEERPETADDDGFDEASGIQYDTSEETFTATVSYSKELEELVDATDVGLKVESNADDLKLNFTNSYTNKDTDDDSDAQTTDEDSSDDSNAQTTDEDSSDDSDTQANDEDSSDDSDTQATDEDSSDDSDTQATEDNSTNESDSNTGDKNETVKKADKSAETGDTNLMLICIGLMLMSMLVIAIVVLRRIVVGRYR